MRKLARRINAASLRFVALFIPPCHEVTRLLSQGMDRPLPWATRLRLRVHLLSCVWCRRYARQLRRLRVFSRAFPTLGSAHAGPGLPASARARMKAALQSESELP